MLNICEENKKLRKHQNSSPEKFYYILSISFVVSFHTGKKNPFYITSQERKCKKTNGRSEVFKNIRNNISKFVRQLIILKNIRKPFYLCHVKLMCV